MSKTLVKGYLVQDYSDRSEQHYLVHPDLGVFQAVNRVCMPYDSFNLKSWRKIDSLPENAKFCGNYYNPMRIIDGKNTHDTV